MRLRELVAHAWPERATDAQRLPDTVVTGVSQDARRLRPGQLFVARRGARFDGHDFLADAVRAGAVAVVGARHEVPHEALAGLPYLQVADDRAAVARLAVAFHRDPSARMAVAGVTGTDGKTSTATMLWWLLQQDATTALMGTTGMRVGSQTAAEAAYATTPEADVVQELLARAADQGATRSVLECSSHGLALGRLDGVRFATATWTNLAPEHLDFHGDLGGYAEAKATLVRRARIAILNRDDAAYPTFEAAAREVGAELRTFGSAPEADWRLLQVHPVPGGVSFRFRGPDGHERTAQVPSAGTFQAFNALAAIATADAHGLPPARTAARLAAFPGVPGRMQAVASEPFQLLVDFAHTAPALAKALAAVTPTAPKGRRIVVIGAAGERDPGKRAPLGRAAAAGADLVILTEEDHRSESLARILDAMEAGAREAGAVPGASLLRVADRREAIRTAVAAAGPGDVVLLAGKGHEATLQRGAELLPWNEVEEARSAFAAVLPDASDAALG